MPRGCESSLVWRWFSSSGRALVFVSLVLQKTHECFLVLAGLAV